MELTDTADLNGTLRLNLPYFYEVMFLFGSSPDMYLPFKAVGLPLHIFDHNVMDVP